MKKKRMFDVCVWFVVEAKNEKEAEERVDNELWNCDKSIRTWTLDKVNEIDQETVKEVYGDD